ncbi:MAG: GTP-binding protein [Veillonella atypica]
MIPVYIVTGLLGSGKTSLINVDYENEKNLALQKLSALKQVIQSL